jgi:CheY-like chemotaxis protein
MMKALSREEFVRNLSDSGLFSPEEVRKSLDVLAGLPPDDGAAVAERLVESGSLTRFQAEAVRERNFEQLQIGNYQILDRLGAGGMGTVYKARHRRMKRVVAIKVLSASASKSDTFVQRFQREVEAVARLSHPNIVMAYDADEAEVGHFLVMEFVNGRDLATEVQKRGPLPVREAVTYIAQAARALEYAHAQGIVHRDIKPANLLRDDLGVVKVADLGLARFSDSAGRPPEENALTQAGSIMGTVDYMSPEQALGLTNIDHRADIYSLGCTLHFLLLGQPPYIGVTMMATLLAHREAPIPSLSAAHPAVPAALDEVFRRMMAKAPADRYATMAEVAAALTAVEGTLGEAGAARAAAAPPPAAPDATAYFAPGSTQVSPPAPAAAGQTVDLGPAKPAPADALKVVLVEPSRTQAGIIRRYFQSQGVQHVVTAATGKEALELVRRERPAAVVSTLYLSDMTGVELAQQIRQDNPAGAPGFILISSEAESADAGSLSQCGRAHHLLKPFTPEELVTALKLVTAGPPAAADRAKLRVLIVDDSTPARLHVRAVLQGLGLSQFVEAADGAQAVAAIARGSFDLVVTDYNMPFLDGRALIAYLKQNPATAALPVIMVTTEQDPAKLEAVRQLDVAAVCDKSFPADVVRGVLDRLVAKS